MRCKGPELIFLNICGAVKFGDTGSLTKKYLNKARFGNLRAISTFLNIDDLETDVLFFGNL